MGAIDISDLDAIDAGKLKLELKGSKNFQIDSSGNIKTMERLDREKIANYKFEIIATDSIKPFNTAKVSIGLISGWWRKLNLNLVVWILSIKISGNLGCQYLKYRNATSKFKRLFQAMVEIEVLDENDSAPLFKKDNYEVIL